MGQIRKSGGEMMAAYPFPFILGFLVLFFAQGVSSGEEAAESFRGKVLGVASGDTLIVMRDDKAEKVSVAGVVAPHYEQNSGKEAKMFLGHLVRLKDVTVVLSGTATIGIPRARIDLDDGRKVAEELLKNGWAWWDREDAKEDERFKEMESVAREAKKGLWIEENPIPPWEFRKEAPPNPTAGTVPEVLGKTPFSSSAEIPATANIVGSTGFRRIPVETNYSLPRTSTPNLPRQTEYWSIDNRRRNSYQRGVQRHTTEHLYYNQRRR
jgi:endonuclease YncB( thermonuclease family)